MKVQGISNTNYLTYKQLSIKNEKESLDRNYRNKILTLGGAAILGVTLLACVLKRKSVLEVDSFKNNLSQRDLNYYNNIIENLKESGIETNIESLKSIVSPDEFNKLVRKFKPEHYRAGLQISEEKATNISLKDFYKNAVDGNFRVSLHTHSNFSDGKATVNEFLECATKYANKVAKMNKNDGLPPFTIALTDHDCIEGCCEIIKIIAQNPDKYKNLKFVAGCEFSVQNGYQHHDITGLALNPFDKNLNKVLKELSKERLQIVDEFLEKQPLYNGKKITRIDVAEFEKKHYTKEGKSGKRCVENGSGIVAVRHGIKFYYKLIGQDVNHQLVNELGDKKILSIDFVIKSIKDNGGYASLTHPMKSFWRYIGDEALLKFKDMGIDGIEVNHQYTPSKVTKLGKINNNINKSDEIFENLTNQYRVFAEKNGLFLSGGTDCHEKQIFSRQPQITEEFLNEFILK